jgi:hypothetical protein
MEGMCLKRYEPSVFLREIAEWEQGFKNSVPYLKTPTSLFLSVEEMDLGEYFCTPLDAIVFARTGMDGIHYAMLTEFGTVPNLDEALIIAVLPMDEPRVRLVARNIRDFFALHVFDESLLLNEFSSEEEYRSFKFQQDAEDQTSDWFDHKMWKEQKSLVQQTFREKFQINPIPEPYKYIEQLKKERTSKVLIQTNDGLGVIPLNGSGVPLARLDFRELQNNVIEFFETATIEQKLAYIREYQHEFEEDTDELIFLYNELNSLGFGLEAKRLVARMDEYLLGEMKND